MTMDCVREFYWKTLKQESISTAEQAEKFEQALILLDLEETIAQRQILENPKLTEMFREKEQYLNLLEESSDDESSLSSKSLDAESILGNLKMENQEIPKQEFGETAEQGERRGQKRKGEFYPATSEFKINPGPFGSNVLYLDCILNKKDRKQKIDVWAKEISLIIQTATDKYDDQASALLLLDHKTAGIANNVLKETTWVPTLSPVTTFNNVVNTFYTLFLGVDFVTSKEVEENKIKEKAKDSLLQMQICDICQLDQFYCLYEKHMYATGNQLGYPTYVENYIRKIPLVGEKAVERFLKESNEFTRYSLAFAHELVKEEISKICDLARKQKQLKSYSKKCCNKIVEPSLTFGCTPQYKPKNKKKFVKKKFNKYRFKKKRKTFKPGKFFRKKNPNKQKFCPKDKKNCRCWICNEEGHYANECPNRKQNHDKVKVLEEIISLGFEPVEEEYEGYQNILIYEIDPGDSSNESLQKNRS